MLFIFRQQNFLFKHSLNLPIWDAQATRLEEESLPRRERSGLLLPANRDIPIFVSRMENNVSNIPRILREDLIFGPTFRTQDRE